MYPAFAQPRTCETAHPERFTTELKNLLYSRNVETIVLEVPSIETGGRA